LSSRGQVTIPLPLREKYGLHAGDEVEVVEDGQVLRIVPIIVGSSPGQRLVRRTRGRSSSDVTTDEIMNLLRGE
jgi:AbrB family looped-hinge helix DNA binding protein